MSDHDSLKTKKRTGCFILCGVIIAVALAGGGFLGWRAWLAAEKAMSIAERFQQALNFTPEIRVNSRVVVTGTTPILELATVEKQAVVRHSWSETWLHSTKTLEVEATFTARAGFDLQRHFQITLNTRAQTMSAQLPPAKILSIGMSDVRIIKDEDGLWNKLSAADRETALSALQMKAQQEFRETHILLEARMEGEKRVRELLESASGGERFEWISSTPHP